MTDEKKRMVITLAIPFVMTLIFNVGLVLSNPNQLSRLAEPTIFELAVQSDTSGTYQIVLFGIHDLYDAHHFTITPEAATSIPINQTVLDRYNDRLQLTYTVDSFDIPDLDIGPDAVFYERPGKVPVIFLSSDRPRLLVFVHEGTVIVMAEES